MGRASPPAVGAVLEPPCFPFPSQYPVRRAGKRSASRHEHYSLSSEPPVGRASLPAIFLRLSFASLREPYLFNAPEPAKIQEKIDIYPAGMIKIY